MCQYSKTRQECPEEPVLADADFSTTASNQSLKLYILLSFSFKNKALKDR